MQSGCAQSGLQQPGGLPSGEFLARCFPVEWWTRKTLLFPSALSLQIADGLCWCRAALPIPAESLSFRDAAPCCTKAELLRAGKPEFPSLP